MIYSKVVSVAIAAMLFITTTQATYTRFCKGIWKPSPGMPWHWQIYNTPSQADIDASNAQVFDLDLYNTDQSLIDYIHSKNKAMICYIDSQYEPNRPDSDKFKGLLGNGIDGWPGQYWVDIRSKVIWDIMKGRAELALSKGCDAIEWDDVDGYANNNGLNLTAQDQLTFNKYLADLTHSLGMSVGLKNDVDQLNELVGSFDWALNEECFAHSECGGYDVFIKAGKAVFGTEYTGTAESFCSIQNAAKLSWLYSDLNLDGKGTVQCCSYLSPPCPSVPYTCDASATTSSSAPTTSSPSATTSGSSSDVVDAHSEQHPNSGSLVSISVFALACSFLALFL